MFCFSAVLLAAVLALIRIALNDASVTGGILPCL